ncbi:hypothetical protein TB2_035576 [Malus domestica]
MECEIVALMYITLVISAKNLEFGYMVDRLKLMYGLACSLLDKEQEHIWPLSLLCLDEHGNIPTIVSSVLPFLSLSFCLSILYNDHKFRRLDLNYSFFTILFLILLLPILTSSACTSEKKDEHRNESKLLIRYKLIAIASVLVSGALGVCLPFLVKNIPFFHPEKDLYLLIKAFVAGVILATGFVHLLPDANDSLTSPCLSENPWRRFPFTGFVAMVSAIGTLIMEAIATGYQKRSELGKPQPVDGYEENDHAVHFHGSASNSPELIRHRIISQVLELGILVHSVIIGISLGACQSQHTIKPLVAALSFHQFF